MKLMQSMAVALVFSSALVACDRRDDHLQDEARSEDTTIIDEDSRQAIATDPDVASQAVDARQRCTGLTGQALTDCEAEAAAATGAHMSTEDGARGTDRNADGYGNDATRSSDNTEPPVGD